MSNPTSRRRFDDPELTRQKGLFSHPGTLLVAAAAMLFTAYIFNVGGLQTTFDARFDSFNKGAQSHNDTVVNFTVAAIPVAGALIALLVLWWILRAVSNSFRKMQKSSRLSKRESLSLHEFQAMAAKHGITSKVSSHTYRFLTPYYHDDMRAKMDDLLREDLHMTEPKVRDAMANLLHRCDRKKNLEASPEGVLTVLDLMKYVEKAPAQFLTHSGVRRVRGEQQGPDVVRTEAVGETRIVKPLHKRSGMMNAVRKLSGVRRAAVQAPVEPREPKARPTYPDPAIVNGKQAKPDVAVGFRSSDKR